MYNVCITQFCIVAIVSGRRKAQVLFGGIAGSAPSPLVFGGKGVSAAKNSTKFRLNGTVKVEVFLYPADEVQHHVYVVSRELVRGRGDRVRHQKPVKHATVSSLFFFVFSHVAQHSTT